jgi:SAM-dependent methyltransferase
VLTILLILLASLLLVLIAWTVGGIFSALSGAPLVPSKKSTVAAILTLAQLKPGECVVDLGAGDGRLVFAAAALGANAIGYEISWPAYLWSRLLQIAGRHGGRLQRADLFRVSLRDADVVFCYLLPQTMQQLTPKLTAELLPHARVITHAFPVPGWPVLKQEGRVFLQTKPKF